MNNMNKILWMLLAFCSVVCAQTETLNNPQHRGRLKSLAQAYTLKAMPMPDWAKRDGEVPVLKVAWLSDMHNTIVKGALKKSIKAFEVIRKLNPDFVILTGDDNSKPISGYESFTLNDRIHLRTKQFLAEMISVPVITTSGDNWAEGYETAFGAHTRCYQAGGFQFLVIGCDEKAQYKDASARYFPETIQWVDSHLKKTADMPTIILSHEPAIPPVHLGAKALEGIASRHENVLAVFSGHLHMDLEFDGDGYKQIICPSTANSEPPGFKWICFYGNAIVIRNYEWNPQTETFEKAPKWQKVSIPYSFWDDIHARKNDRSLKGVATMRPTPIKFNPELVKRMSEVDSELLRFCTNFGLKQVFSLGW